MLLIRPLLRYVRKLLSDIRNLVLIAEPALKRLIREFGQARSTDPLASAARLGRWMDAAFFGLRRS